MRIQGCLEARDLWSWEREVTPHARTWVPLVLVALAAAIYMMIYRLTRS